MRRDDPPSLIAALPPQEITRDVLAEKYLKGDERTEVDVFTRVARALASVEPPPRRAEWEAKFLANLHAGAIGAGRIMSAAGTGLQATLINCFVQPVGDSIQGVDDEGRPGIYEALREAAETMRRGGGVGYDFSAIRPRGAQVRATASLASGPCSYIDVFDHSCATVESAGARRGAQMGVLRIDHPDVLEFIRAKRTPGRWNNFNVSVAVPDAFMHALREGGSWPLVHRAQPGQALVAAGAHQREDDGMWVYRTVAARELWDTVMRSTYEYAEPGILFLDTINRDNNLRAIERLDATNPCAEEPLPAYGCCDLGPVILTRFVRHPFGIGGEPAFDFDAFADVVAVQVRALDNVLDLTYWPLAQQREQARAKRRIGVGFTGLGNALAMLRLRYDRDEGREMAVRIARAMRDAAYGASVELAREKGAFPLFDAAQYLEPGTSASRLPQPLQDAIRRHGIRNSHLLAIAPTGTVSLAFADNASNGVEPSFSWTYRRRKRAADGTSVEYAVEDHALRLYRALSGAVGRDGGKGGKGGKGGEEAPLPEYFVSALQMDAQAHLAMVQAVQPYIDTAISKTVNVAADYPFEDFRDLYRKAWEAGLKGLSTYRPNEILGAVLQTGVAATSATAAEDPGLRAAPDDPMRAVIGSRPSGALPAVAEKVRYWTQAGEQTLYLVISFMPVEGGRERAIEFFMPVGQSGESQQWITASMRLLSLAARGGFLERALADMRKVAWDRGPVRLGTYTRADGVQVPRWHDSEVAAIAYAVQELIASRQRAVGSARHADDATGPDAGAGARAQGGSASASVGLMPGRKCPECGAHAVIRKDGCEYCTSCGHVGACG